MSSNGDVSALVEQYGLATGWDIQFVAGPGDVAAAVRELRDAGLGVAGEDAEALAARGREIVDWLANDAQALESFAADPWAALAARDACRPPRRPRGGNKGSFSAAPAGRKAALARGRDELGAWALSSSENLRLLLRDPAQASNVVAHGRDPKEVRALAASLTREPKPKVAQARRHGTAGDR